LCKDEDKRPIFAGGIWTLCVLWKKKDLEMYLNIVFVWRVVRRMKEKDLI
jgi:hypothetical protein